MDEEALSEYGPPSDSNVPDEQATQPIEEVLQQEAAKEQRVQETEEYEKAPRKSRKVTNGTLVVVKCK